MSVDDLFDGGAGSAADDAARADAALRPVGRWRRAAGVLNYLGFLGGLGLVFVRGAADALPEALGGPAVIAMGLTSMLAVPGALVSVWAWIRADETLRAARSGALPALAGAPAFRARQQAFVVLGVAALCLVVQLWALSNVLGGQPQQ